MGMEDRIDIVNDAQDFSGEITESIKDITIDIAEISKEIIENLGDEGLEALKNGDIKGLIESHDDMSDEEKEFAKEFVDYFEIDIKKILVGVAEVGVGVAEVLFGVSPLLLAVLNEGFAGLAAYAVPEIGSFLINLIKDGSALFMKGIRDISSQFNNKNANELEAYTGGYSYE